MAMSKFGSAQGVGRLEDIRLLSGQGRYVDDIAPEAALHAYFLRAQMAHAAITDLSFDEARASEGVHLVLAAADLEALGVTLGMASTQVKVRGGGKGAAPERPLLARGVVRYAGEAVAVVVAETLQQARDAADLIGLDVEERPVVTALVPGGETIHPEAPGNLAFDYTLGNEAAVAAALEASAHRVCLDVVHNRIIVASMEPRGCFAEWDGTRLHLAFNGQGVWVQKDELARQLHLPKEAVRVTNPDVGGGFGMKGMTYPEYGVVAAAARALGRPVRWMSDRSEAMLSDNAGRDLIARAELGFDADHKITGFRVNIVSNLGAYNSQFAQMIQTELYAKVLTGVYDIKACCMGVLGVYTNTTPVDAYRGAGRPEANLTIERVMDHAARVLGVDGFDLRLKNVIRTFPYPLISGAEVDCGDFANVLALARAKSDAAGFAARQAEAAARGRLRGLGIGCYLEAILGSPVETARVVLEADGGATLFVGTQSNGQGHETVYARMLSEQTGIDISLIRIVQGDSDAIPSGGGTGGSRSVTVQGTATRAVVGSLVAGLIEFLENDVGVKEVGFDGEVFSAPNSNMSLTMAEAAEWAREKGRQELLDVSETIKLQAGSYPNGAHVCEVEVDPETGALEIIRYTVVDDFGNLINEALVAGQVHGGIVQGFGHAVIENAVYSEDGQLLTGSFMDYALPRASDVPFFEIHHAPTITKTNPLGMKGCGEAGTVGSCGAITNAVLDALAPVGVKRVDMPLSPSRIWAWIEEAKAATV
jgi:aerobic carbon-monoxide dehydrogenase large subunit